jgi:hypothetical protein
MRGILRARPAATAPHQCAGSGRPCLYEAALRQAIATQHHLTDTRGTEFGECPDCGAPYLLEASWQPLSDDGELCCPRCGAIVATWVGARSYAVYWYQNGHDLRAG